MRIVCIILACGMAGCATYERATTIPRRPAPTAAAERPAAPAIVTRYELGEYRYPRDPSGEHETAVYRSTRVGAARAGASGPDLYPTISYDPLPPSAELATELAVQRQVTGELRAIRSAVVALQEKIRRQYGALVTQTEETRRIGEQLEVERTRVREHEARLIEAISAPTRPVPPSPVRVSTPTEEVKW